MKILNEESTELFNPINFNLIVETQDELDDLNNLINKWTSTKSEQQNNIVESNETISSIIEEDIPDDETIDAIDELIKDEELTTPWAKHNNILVNEYYNFLQDALNNIDIHDISFNTWKIINCGIIYSFPNTYRYILLNLWTDNSCGRDIHIDNFIESFAKNVNEYTGTNIYTYKHSFNLLKKYFKISPRLDFNTFDDSKFELVKGNFVEK